MKKTLLILSFTTCLISCSSYDDPYTDTLSHAELTEQYEYYKANAQKRIGQTFQVLAANPSRSDDSTQITSSDLINLLISMPKEKVDSLYNIYCTSEKEQEYEKLYSTSIDELIRQSSLEEVQSFYNFADDYLESGGNNMIMLMDAIKDKAPIIQGCMINSAASIDEYLSASTVSRNANDYCLDTLLKDVVKSQIENVAIDAGRAVAAALIASPEVDALAGLLILGVDLYSSIKLAHEYNLCVATHVS